MSDTQLEVCGRGRGRKEKMDLRTESRGAAKSFLDFRLRACEDPIESNQAGGLFFSHRRSSPLDSPSEEKMYKLALFCS